MTPTEAIAALEKALEAVLHPAKEENALAQAMHERDARRYFNDAANPLAIRTLLDAHAGALRDAEALRDERDELTDVLHRGGFVRCDIAACNCGSWHARFGYPERFREFTEALEQHGVNLHAGKTALNLLNEALDELDAARAALATNTKAQP